MGEQIWKETIILGVSTPIQPSFQEKGGKKKPMSRIYPGSFTQTKEKSVVRTIETKLKSLD